MIIWLTAIVSGVAHIRAIPAEIRVLPPRLIKFWHEETMPLCSGKRSRTARFNPGIAIDIPSTKKNRGTILNGRDGGRKTLIIILPSAEPIMTA